MPTSRTSSHPTTGTVARGRPSRAESDARDEIIAMLKSDHARVKKIFRDFQKLDPHEDAEQCETLVTQACEELEKHASLEEGLFYPASRNCLSDEDLIDEAEVEHMMVKTLISQLREMSPEDEKYAATFKVLGEYVKHHVAEEEGEIFPKLARARFDWPSLQQEMSEHRIKAGDEEKPSARTTEKNLAGAGHDSEDDVKEG